jgi:hypothetical protein
MSATFTITMDEVDEINLKMDEALAMAEVLAAAAGRDMDPKNLSTYASMLQEKIGAVKEGFDRATKEEKVA